jgi:cysteine desulfurase
MIRPIYLDHAAGTPLDDVVLNAMLPYFSDKFYNPSATYNFATKVHKDIEASRAKVGYWLGARPNEIIFTAGGSEANNLAIHGVMRQFPSGNLVISSIEHESVIEAAKQYDYREVKVHPDGTIDLNDLEQKIDSSTVLVSIMYANNEIGTIQPIKQVGHLIKTKRAERLQTIADSLPLYFHTDACQAANYMDLHFSRLGVDMMTLNGGKIYGPKQSGAIFIKSSVKLKPLVYGGGQERGLRSGTENVPSIIGFSEALDISQNMRHTEVERLEKLQTYFIEQLTAKFPEAIINGSPKKRLPNNVHVTFPGKDNERLLIQLDEAGIMAAAASACSASDDEPSHVLKSIGLSDADARSSLRFTMGRSTSMSQIEALVNKLSELLSN